MISINKLCQDAHATAVEKGWYDYGQRNVPEVLMLMVSELAEALEEYRTGRHITEIYHEGKIAGGGPGKPCGFAVELADCVIRIADTCAALGIDLESVITEKMAYNATRPHRHGGKIA